MIKRYRSRAPVAANVRAHLTLLFLAKRYGLPAAIAIGAVVLAFPMLQIAWNSSSLRKLYHPDPVHNIQGPRFSSDESKLAFSVTNPSRITICDLADQKATILTAPKGFSVARATFDPRTPRIAFVLWGKLANGDWDYQIATSRFDGTGLKVLTSSDTQKQFPDFAFDGSKILFEGKERCPGEHRSKYCRADLYELDVYTNQEKRLTDLQALQVAPASYLPGNNRIALTVFGSAYSRARGYDARVDVEAVYGDKQRVFVVDLTEPGKLIPVSTGTPTATSPRALRSGEIAFLARVNEYDGVKGAGYVYDVFINGAAGNRRHTKVARYIRDYGISGSAKLVAFVVETRDKPAKAELKIWSVETGRTENLHCSKSMEERELAP